MIYIVTQGKYSDYRVVAATTDLKIAKKIQKKFDDDWDKCRIEEYPDAEVMLKNLWKVYFTKEGNVWRYDICDSAYEYRESRSIVDTIYKHDYDMIVRVEADTADDAIKIAAEKRAEYLAEKYHL